MPSEMPEVYTGDRPYIFVSYAHADEAALQIIGELVGAGYRVWYDDGVEPSVRYSDYLADHVYGCDCFMPLISRASIASDWCREEAEYALDQKKKVLPVYLEEVELPRGLQLRMGNKQALFWYRSADEFYRRLFKARRLEDCLTDEGKRNRGVKVREVQAKAGGPAADGAKATDKGGVAPTGSTQYASQTPRVAKPTLEREIAPQTAKEQTDSIADARPASSGQAYEGARIRFLERMAQEVAVKPRNAVPGVEPKGSLADYSWPELKQISRAIAAAGSDAEWKAIAREYRLVDSEDKLHGAEKPLKLNDGTDASVRILGFRHDELTTGGKAGISFEFAGVPTTHRMNSDWTNAGGWEKSDMREWLNSDFLALLPDDLRTNVAGARKRTNNRGRVPKNDTTAVTETDDALWLLSMSEVYGRLSAQRGNVPPSPATYDAEGTQYQLYREKGVSTTNYASCIKKDNNEADSWWWLRSPSAFLSYRFRCVGSDGGWDGGGADGVGGVSPGFCF